jgi:hypothetical protein
LSKKKGDRKRASSGKRGRGHSQASDRTGDLVRLARSHGLEMLSHLLRMAELEAEEYLRLRGKQKLS